MILRATFFLPFFLLLFTSLSHAIPSTNTAPELNLTAQERNWLKQHPVINLGIDRTFPPYEWLDKDNNYQGFAADFMRLIEQRLNIKFNIIKNKDTWNDVLDAAKNSELDMLSCLVRTPERAQYLNFTPPYISSSAVIITEQGNTHISTLQQLVGKQVAISKGHYVQELLIRHHPQISLILAKNIPEALQLVATGKADAFVGDVMAASYAIKNASLLNLSLAGQTSFQSQFSLGTSKQHPELYGIMQKALASITEQERASIYDRWNNLKITQGISYNTAVQYSLAILALFMLFVYWIYRLKRSEQARKDSEAKLHAVLDNAPVGIWLSDKDSSYTYVNDTFCKSVGIAENDFINCTDLHRLVGDEMASNCLASDQACLAQDTPYVSQETLPFVDDKEHTLEITKTKLRDAAGKTVGIIGVSMDITERQQADLKLQQSEAHFRFVAESAQALIWLANTDKLCFWFNKVWLDFTGRTMEQEYGNGWTEGVHPDDLQRYIDYYVEHFDRHEPFSMGYRLKRHDGEYRWILDKGMPRFDANNQFEGYIGSCFDITEHKEMEASLQLSATVYEHTSEAMMLTDANNRILAVNPAFTTITGYTAAESIGQHPKLLQSGRQDAQFYQEMWQILKTTGTWQGEIWNRHKDGHHFAEQMTINTIFSDAGEVKQRVTLFSDITEKKKSDELIWQQANFDVLTHLPNRHMFHDRLEQELIKSHREKQPLALLFIDLDRFKEVNDTLGHEIGDLLLIQAAQRITSCVRESDTVARLGGDEFTVILPEIHDGSHIERIANAIIDALAQPFRLNEQQAYISASIGITLYPDDGDALTQLLKNADQAMYRAKNLGRNRSSYFTPAMQEAAQKHLQILNDLRGALSNQQLQLYYQPIVDLATGEVHKAEALIRWMHPTRGMISPADFIPIAEDSGLIIEIGDWVFKEAARQAKQWIDLHDQTIQISINKSPVQFHATNDQSAWLAYLQELGLSGKNIVIEITEGLLMETSEHIIEQLLQYRDAGIQVSIDDFGTGYSSLAYLNKFDIDYLKIDQSFTRNLAPNSNDLALSEAIIVMAQKLGLKVIAEGIETEEQRQLLLEAGCDFGQGYLFSRPVPADEFIRLLNQK